MDTETTRSELTEQESKQVEELPLPADKQAPGIARGVVRDRWPELGEEVLDDVTLIVSELVSNAVQHGRPDILLRILVAPFAVDVSVLDHGPAVPSVEVAPPTDTATSGRGLAIVNRLASDWGVEPLSGSNGKSVWARLRRDVTTEE